MKRYKIIPLVLAVAMALSLFLGTPAGALSGRGFKISELVGAQALDGGPGIVIFRWAAGGGTNSESYVQVPGTTGMTFSYSLLENSNAELVVGGSEIIEIDASGITLCRVSIENGTLNLTGSAIKFGTNTIVGKDTATEVKLKNNSLDSVPVIQGTFNSLDGTGAMKLAPDQETMTADGNPIIIGNDGILRVNGGQPSVSGIFARLNVEKGTVQVKQNAYTDVLAFGANGTLAVSANTYFATENETICPAADTTYVNGQWGSLTAGDYNAISGSWKMVDDGVRILDTKKLDKNDLDHPVDDAVNLLTEGKDLTVTGGTVNIQAQSGESETKVGDLTIKGGTVVTPSAGQYETFVTADKIVIEGDGKFKINKDVVTRIAVTDTEGGVSYPTVIQPVNTHKDVPSGYRSATLTSWGELAPKELCGEKQQYNLRGEWILPAGVTGYIGGYQTEHEDELGDIEKMATVNGHGGTLVLSDVNVAAKGFFTKVTTKGQFLAVPVGSTLSVRKDTTSTDIRSVRPCYNPTGAITGDEVDKQFIKIANMTELPSSAIDDEPNWDSMTAEQRAAKAYRYADLVGDWVIKQGNYVAVESTSYTYTLGTDNYSGDNVRFSVSTPQGYTGTDKAVVFTYTDAQDGTGDIKIEKSPTSQQNLSIQAVKSAIVIGNNYELDAKGKTYIKGSFSNLTGEVYLIGDTTIHNTTKNDPQGVALVHGEGQSLTIKGGKVEVEGEFEQLVDATGSEAHRFEDHDLSDPNQAGGIHIVMTQNLTLKNGICGIKGENIDATLTVRGTAFVHAQGEFKQINVCENGTLVDCGGVKVSNHEAAALTVEDHGTAIFDHNDAAFSAVSDTVPVNTVKVSGGCCEFLSGTISARANNAKAVNVSGGVFTIGYDRDVTGAIEDYRDYMHDDKPELTASEFYIGGHEMPKISVYGSGSRGILAEGGGEVFVRACEIFFEQNESRGISDERGGIVHIYPNDADGRDDVTRAWLIYIHGGLDSARAMHVDDGASFDICGRGALLEEPRTSSQTMPYALFVDAGAVIGDHKPLAGGTFNGKVVYDGNNVYDLLAYNCYVRYDGTAQANFDATDGTYGIHPTFNEEQAKRFGVTPLGDEKTNPEKLGGWIVTHAGEESFSPDGYSFQEVGLYDTYTELRVLNCLGRSTKGHPAQFYSVVDAEWELRRNMADENGSYQIPVGMGGDKTTLYLDGNSYAEDTWAASVKGDVDVLNGGHTLYLAGRNVEFTGKTMTDGAALTDTPGRDLAHRGVKPADAGFGDSGDSNTAFAIHVNPDSALTVRDCIFGKLGTNLTAKALDGGFVATGAVKYSSFEDAERDTGVIYSEGSTNLVSGKFLADEAGFRATALRCSDGVTNVGGFLNDAAEEPTTANENNSNQLLVLRGGTDEGYEASSDPAKVPSKNVYLLPYKLGADTLATVYIYGGVIGALDGEGATMGALNDAGTLNVCGGILTGDGSNGEGVVLRTDSSTVHVSGGCIYSDYGTDNYQNASGSIDVRKGQAFLNVDAAHSANAFAGGKVGYITGAPAGLKTYGTHHLDNVKISGGALYLGADEPMTGPVDPAKVRGLTHINGNLECSGGLTVSYDGMVAGDTNVIGAVQSPFGTGFQIWGGNFGSLTVADHPAVMGAYDYHMQDGTGFESYVRLHGGTYASISVEGLHTSPEIRSAQELVGYWTDAMDFDDNGATDNWTMFNHYATVESTIGRDANHRWSQAAAAMSDPNRAVSGKTIRPEQGGIIVRDAAKEFVQWATAVDGGSCGQSYALPINILLGENTLVCDPYFSCTSGAALPVAIAGGTHTLDTNNFAVAGNTTGSLLQLTAGSASITNGNTATETIDSANQIRNFCTTGSTAAAMEVCGGTKLSTSAADGNLPVIFRARNVGAEVAAGAELEMQNSSAIGDQLAGIRSAGKTELKTDCTVSSANGSGIVETAGSLTVGGDDEILGELFGIEAKDASTVTVCGTDGHRSTITGKTKDGVRMGTGKLKAEYADITGKDYGVYSDTDVELKQSTVASSVHEGVRSAANVLAEDSTVSGYSGIVAQGSVTVTGSSTVTGEKYDGIAADGAVTLTGDTEKTVTVTGVLQTGVRGKTLNAAYANITGNASGAELTELLKLSKCQVISVNPNSAQGGVLVTAADGASEIVDSTICVTNLPGTAPALRFTGKTDGKASLTVDSTQDGPMTVFGEAGKAAFVEVSNSKLFWKNAQACSTVTASGEKIEVSNGSFAANVTFTANNLKLSGGSYQAEVQAKDCAKFEITGGSYTNGFTLTSSTGTVKSGSFGGTFTVQSGSDVTVKSDTTTAPLFFELFRKTGGTAKLLNGTYGKIVTDDPQLSAIIPGSAKDATDRPVTVTNYVLRNNQTLQAGSYDTTGEGAMVTYAAPFTLSSVPAFEPIAPVGGGGSGVWRYTVEAVDVSADKAKAAEDEIVTVTVNPEPGKTLETIAVLDEYGQAVAVEKLDDTHYSFMMPAGKVTVKAVYAPETGRFVDVFTTDYYYDAVQWAVENGITNGLDDTHFGPNESITRAQVVTFLWRAAGEPEPTGDASMFIDVPADEYYAKAVAWAVEQGITKGTSDTEFSPEAICTRGQIVTFLARFAGVEDEPAESVFSDVSSSDYFAAAVQWAKENGITDGTSDTTFSPEMDCTRGQVVTFLYRWMVR